MTPTGDQARCDLEMLAAYALGELEPAARDQITAHLVDCNHCWQHLRTARAATAAVQQLWEPAPASLRADLRATVLAAPIPRTAPVTRRRRVVISLAAAATVAAATIGIVELRHTGPAPDTIVTQPALPTPVQAALARYTQPATGRDASALAPDLGRIGLHLQAATRTQLSGVPAQYFTYLGPTANRVDLLVSQQPWARPTHTQPLGASGWITTDNGVTILAGPDRADDQMLIIAADHTAAMSAAATLGIV